MKQIDLEPGQYRQRGFRSEPAIHKVLMRSAALCGIWFIAVVIFGRYADHNQPWYFIAAFALSPLALLFYIAVSLDD